MGPNVLYSCIPVESVFSLAKIFFCRSGCLSGQTGGGQSHKQTVQLGQNFKPGAPKQKLLLLKNIQKYHWVKHKDMLILFVSPDM
jgi:hypothetical protein